MTNKLQTITTWIPIYLPLRLLDLYCPEDFEECLCSFKEDLSDAVSVFNPSLKSVIVSSVSPPDPVSRHIEKLNNSIPRFTFLKVDAQFDDSPINVEYHGPDGIKILVEPPGPMLACDICASIDDILTLTSLAMPCRINTGIGQSYYKGKPLNTTGRFHGVSGDIIYNRDLKWPEIFKLTLKEVLAWETKLGLFASGMASTPLQRSLASLTHVIGNTDSEYGELLFWSMQGLEAIYCTGKSELRGQLTEKSKVLLGQWDDSKNIVGSLYDMRSKFVHGSHNIARKGNEFELNKDERKYEDELFHSTSLAVRLLFSTIQKCILLNKIELNFEYVLKN